jgi:hypothetical protein
MMCQGGTSRSLIPKKVFAKPHQRICLYPENLGLTPSTDRTRFSVFMENKQSSGDPRFTINSVTLVPTQVAVCPDLAQMPFTTNGNSVSFTCTKPGDQELTLAADTSRGPIQPLTVPARTEVPPSLEQRLGNIDARINSLLSVGSIIPFFGSAQDAQAAQGAGWWICDGRQISDPASLLNGSKTPDLRDKFIMGGASAGGGGGQTSFSIPNQTIVSLTNGFSGSAPAIHNDPRTAVCNSQGWCTGAPIQSAGTWNGVNIPTLPPYTTVIFLMKVR